MSATPLDFSATTEYLAVAQVAKILSVSEMTVTRQFQGRKGVIDLGTAETMRKRKRRLLRIPRWAVDNFITEKRVAA